MNAFMTIHVNVNSAAAIAKLRQVEAANYRAAGGVRSVGQAAQWGLPYLSKWGNQIQWAGRQLMYNFTLPIALAMGAATKFALENEKGMVRIAKVYGDGGKVWNKLSQKELPALEEAFVALSNKFAVHRAEVLEIAGDWAAAGASGIALAKATEATLETMILGELNAAEATKNLIAIQAQYGLGVTELSKAVAYLNIVENQTGTTMKDLMDGMARAAGVARVAGVDMEHLLASIAALTPAAGSASTAGNSLKTIFSRILVPTYEANELLEAMNINIKSLEWNSLTGAQRLELLATEFENLSSAQRTQIATVMGSRWQLNRLVILMKAVRNENSYYNKALRATSNQQRVFNQRQQELQKILESNPQKLKQAWIIIQNAIADVIVPLLPYIVQLAQYVADLADKFSSLSLMTQKWVLAGLILLALLGPVARYVGAVANMVGLLSGFFHAFLPVLGRVVMFMGAPFFKVFSAAGRAIALFMGVFWKLFYTVKIVMPAILGLWVAGLRGMMLLVGVGGGAVVKAWTIFNAALIMVSRNTWQALLLIQAAFSAGWIRLHAALGQAVVAIWVGFTRILPALASLSLRAVWAVFATIGSVLLSPWVALGLAIMGVAYTFRDEIAGAWGSIVQWIADKWSGVVEFFYDVNELILRAFHMLPQGIQDAMIAVIEVVAEGAKIVYGWLSYLNPFARHSPSLVDSVTAGMDIITRQYARASGLGTVFAKAARDLAAFKKEAASRDEYKEDRRNVVKSRGNVGLFDALRSDLAGLQPVLMAQEAAVAAQEQVVNRWSDALERAGERIDKMQGRLDGLQSRLDKLTDAFQQHEQRLNSFASAPIRGMGAMEDKIFENQQAQKRLELQILRTGEASRKEVERATQAYDREVAVLDKLQTKLSDITAEISKHESALQEFANSPILGMQEMSDAIFENEMAQKALRLEILKLEEAYAGGSVEDFASVLARLQGEIETTQGTINDLRAAGAGSEILGTWQDQLNDLVAKRNSIATAGSGTTTEDPQLVALRKQLEELQRTGEKLDLEQSLKFDPLTREIEQLANAKEELSFDDIVAGIKREQAAIDRLTPAYEKASDAVARQEEVVKKAAAARDRAEEAYAKEERAIQRLQNRLEELQRVGQILQLEYDIKFDPLTREIERLVNAQKELSFDRIIKGIKNEQAAMDALQPRIDNLNAAISRQQAAIDRASAARDRMQSRYDRENAQLQNLQEQYQKTEELVRDIEAALRDMGSAASSALSSSKSGSDKMSNSLENFYNAAGGSWRDPGGKKGIDREGGMDSQADELTAFAESRIREMNEIMGNIDMFAPIKKGWKDLVAWFQANTPQGLKDMVATIHENLKSALAGAGIGALIGGYVLGPLGAVLGAGVGAVIGSQFSKISEAIKNSGISESINKVLDPVKKNLNKLWDLFKPDWERLKSGFIDGIVSFWDEVGPELEKFKELWEPLNELGARLKDIFEPVIEILGSGLVGAFKLVVSIISHTFGPVFESLGKVVANAIQAVRGVLELFLGFLLLDFEKMGSGLADIWSGIWGTLGRLLETGWNIITGIFWGLFEGIQEIFESLDQDVQDKITGMLDAIGDAITAPIDDFTDTFWGLVEDIKAAWDWLYDKLIGNSVIPDIVNGIWDEFDVLSDLANWWENKVTEPIEEVFSKAGDRIENAGSRWNGRLEKAWSELKNAKNWWSKNVWQPVTEGVSDWWDDREVQFGKFWDQMKRAWNNIKSKQWWRDEVWTPIKEGVTDWWANRIIQFGKFWDSMQKAWSNITSKKWWRENVWVPIAEGITDWWARRIENFGKWWNELKDAWDNIKQNVGGWWDRNFANPVKNAITGAFDKVKEWFQSNRDKILNPIRSVVKGIISAINFVIRGINKLSELPGLKFSIAEISLPDNFASGGIPKRKVGGGFMTTGARAIVGEGKQNHPEFVIPTDPTYRHRAKMLLTAAAEKLNMAAVPMHASGGVLGVPRYEEGGVLGTIKSLAGSVKNALTSGVDWIKGSIKTLASRLAMPLIEKGRDFLLDNIKWRPGRAAVSWAIDKVMDWVFNADKVYEGYAQQAQANQVSVGGPPPQAGDWKKISWRGKTFNARTVRMIMNAESLAKRTFDIMQGSYSTSVSQSAGTHAGGGAVDLGPAISSVNNAMIKSGFASWIRNPSQGNWGWHIHAIALGDPTISPSAANQVSAWQRGEDGLASTVGYAKGGVLQPRLYDQGGYLAPGVSLVQNNTGKPETVTTYEQMEDLVFAADQSRWLLTRIDAQLNTSYIRWITKLEPFLIAVTTKMDEAAAASTAFTEALIVKLDEMLQFILIEGFGVLGQTIIDAFSQMAITISEGFSQVVGQFDSMQSTIDSLQSALQAQQNSGGSGSSGGSTSGGSTGGTTNNTTITNNFPRISRLQEAGLSKNEILDRLNGAKNQNDLTRAQLEHIGFTQKRIATILERQSSGLPTLPQTLAFGGIARARRGGLLARIAEAGQDEAVIPLPRSWKRDLIPNGTSKGKGTTVIQINGNLEFPNIRSGEDAEVLIANLKSLSGGAS